MNSPSAQTVPRWQDHPLVHVLAVFLISRLGIMLAGVAARGVLVFYFLEHYTWQYTSTAWLDYWAAWDSGHYLSIVQHGYQFGTTGDVDWNVAFFPLYPLLVSGLKWLTGHSILSGILVANGCFLGALWLLYVYTKEEWGDAAARMATTMCAFFPVGHIFSSMYSESLFLLLTLGIMLSVRRRQWALAGILGALLTATRMNGITLVAPIALAIVLLYRQGERPRWRQLAWLLLFPVGTFLYMGYLQLEFGDPMAFLSVQAAWGRRWHNPVEAIAESLVSVHPANVIHACFVLLTLGLLAWLAWKRHLVDAFAGLCLLGPALISGNEGIPLTSLPRYCLAVYPIYIALGALCVGRPTVYAASLGFLALWTGFFAVAWAVGLGVGV